MTNKIGLKDFEQIEQEVKLELMDPLNKLSLSQLMFQIACEFNESFIKLMHTDKDCFDNPDNLHRFLKEILTDAAYTNLSPVYKRKPL